MSDPGYVTPRKGIRVDQLRVGDQIRDGKGWVTVISAYQKWRSSDWHIHVEGAKWLMTMRYNDTMHARRPVCCESTD